MKMPGFLTQQSKQESERGKESLPVSQIELTAAQLAVSAKKIIARTQEESSTPIAQKESEIKKLSLPEVVFKADIEAESFANDPVKSGLRFRSPYDLKDKRLPDMHPEGQIIFYKNSLKTYGVGEKARQINISRVAHELFHQQFDQLNPVDQDKIVNYFLKKYNFDKIKDYLVGKSLSYQDTFEKTKKYEDGVNKAKRFIINEFIAHAGGFKQYTPDEPKFLIDLLTDAKDILSKYGFSLEKQASLESLSKKEDPLSEEEKNKKLILENELNKAKEAAQAELKQGMDNDPQLTWELKADAAVTGRAYNRFDSNYFNFKAEKLGLDETDLNFLKQYGFDITTIGKKAEMLLNEMENNKEYLQQQQ